MRRSPTVSKTINLDKLIRDKVAQLTLASRQPTITLRAPLGTALHHRDEGVVPGRYNECRTALLYTLPPGRYESGGWHFEILAAI